MKTIKYTLATLMVAAIVAVVLVGCSKEKEPTPQQGNRKPIAMRTTSGEIVSLVDVGKIAEAMSSSKDLDNIVIESIEVQDKTDTEPYYLIVNFIDVENEAAYSTAFEGDYVEEIANYFYETEEFSKGNFGIMDRNGLKYKFESFNFVDPEPDYDPKGMWVTCNRSNCKEGTCKAHHFQCTSCEVDNPKIGYQCTPSDGWLIVVLEIIKKAIEIGLSVFP